MSDQHKPTAGECYYKRHNAHSLPHAYFVWKGDKPLAGPMQEKAAKESCDEINAALAAEREAKMEWAKSCQQLRSQLATAVEELQNITRCDLVGMRKDFGSDADSQFRQWAQNRAKAALAKIGEK